MHIACYSLLMEITIPGLVELRNALQEKVKAFKDVVKIGGALLDATPVTLGQEFSSYVSQLNHGFVALENAMDHLTELALGGTAVGTGINTPKEYAERVADVIAELTGLHFVTAENKFEALAAHDALVEAHGALKTIAVSMWKRHPNALLRTSLRYWRNPIPANEPGSSIMPGKVNPTQSEALTMVSVGAR